MATDVKDLGFVKISDKKNYFVDTNIWLKFLTPPTVPSAEDKKYLIFFKDLLNFGSKKIVITSMLLSEIINRYLKDVSFRQYCQQQGINEGGSTYKHNYRRSPQFKIDFDLICSDLNIYCENCLLCHDHFGQALGMNDIVGNPNFNLDFNDSYYCLLCGINNFSIITHDSDFFIQDVEVITCNTGLIKRQRDSIKPLKN